MLLFVGGALAAMLLLAKRIAVNRLAATVQNAFCTQQPAALAARADIQAQPASLEFAIADYSAIPVWSLGSKVPHYQGTSI